MLIFSVDDDEFQVRRTARSFGHDEVQILQVIAGVVNGCCFLVPSDASFKDIQSRINTEIASLHKQNKSQLGEKRG